MPEADARLFVAVPLPPEAVESCAAVIDEVRRGPLGRIPRWVHVPNLHLTVRFLGEAGEARIPEVVDAVKEAVSGQPAFDVVLTGAGSFPDGRRPRAIWLGIEQGTDRLGALARAVDAGVVAIGWPSDERPYRPHLTVARLDAAPGTTGDAVAQALRDAAAGWRTAFRADRVVLYRSHLGGGQPRHQALLTVPLA